MNNVNVNMANIGPMGGPVGAPMPMMAAAAGVPPQGAPRQQQQQQQQQQQLQADNNSRTLLNTYIYEYFVRHKMWEPARAILNCDPHVKVQKDSPSARRDENGNLVGNGLGDDPMDTDSKDDMDQKRPDDLPDPQVPMPLPDSSFLLDWFRLFWDMLSAQKGKGSSTQVNQFVNHTQVRHTPYPCLVQIPPRNALTGSNTYLLQQQSRLRQEHQQQLLRQMRPELSQQNFHLMRNMQNGGMNMNMAMKPGGNQLPRTAMANSQNK